MLRLEEHALPPAVVRHRALLWPGQGFAIVCGFFLSPLIAYVVDRLAA